MKRTALFVYGVAGHLLFLGIYAWLALFLGNLLLPKTIDAPATEPFWKAVAIDAAVMALFAVQHSVMARPSFKAVWTRIIPKPIERSTYVWVSCAVTALLMWQWRAIDTVIWDVRLPTARYVVWGLFAGGLLMVPAVSLMISHFDLFGTRQVWLHLHGKEYTSLPFRTPSLYSRMRHPLYVGWMISFWAIPTMTAGHMIFAAVMTAYMMIAVIFEERNLVEHFGAEYEEYRRRVPAYIPWARGGKPADGEDTLPAIAPGVANPEL